MTGHLVSPVFLLLLQWGGRQETWWLVSTLLDLLEERAVLDEDV